jgi:hypothetical protein
MVREKTNQAGHEIRWWTQTHILANVATLLVECGYNPGEWDYNSAGHTIGRQRSGVLRMNMNRHFGWIIALAFLGLVPAVQAQQGGKTVKTKRVKDAVEFYIGDELVTRYYTAGFTKPIFWPVNAPGGVPLTRTYPPPPGQATDHPHQKSAWFCHGEIMPDGYKLEVKVKGPKGKDGTPTTKTKVIDFIDFWAESDGHGDIVCTFVGEPKNDGGHASLATKNEWRAADGKKVMDETRVIHFYDLGKARLLVVDIDLHASVGPITFGDTKEGAFGIRINDVIHAEVAKKGKPAGIGKIQNAEGKIGEKDTWGQISPWCDYSGPIDGKLVGLAVLADPKNPYPSCWHVRGYGLMAANPFGREKHSQFPAVKGNNKLVRLEKGQHLQLRYGMLLHEGDAVSGQVAENYQRFVKLGGDEK